MKATRGESTKTQPEYTAMHEKSSPYHGQCLCGAIRYRIAAAQPAMAHCHCSMCRKFHGAAFATFAEVLAEDFQWTRGEDALSAYRAENGTVRRFCRHCGSSLVFQSSNADGSVIEIAMGTLETPIPQQPDAHIFVANAANWHTICDGLPQYPAGRNDDSNE